MHLRIRRTDGKTGSYRQPVERRGAMLATRLDPAVVFGSGPIVIGTHNPFTILNPDEICWIEVETDRKITVSLPPNVDRVIRLSGRDEYETLLARQWPLWQKHPRGAPGDLLESLVELSFRGGDSLYLHATGRVSGASFGASIVGLPAITAEFPPNGTLLINPKCIVRARIYHSADAVTYPSGIWVAEADEL